MILVYSNPKIDRVMRKPPRGFHRVFNNVTTKYRGDANCTGQKCIDCQLCYKFDTASVIVEHVK
jgi:formate hydrogenlyase subunit 6/NADH:ubiquinone oxidoreductase subunit I